MKNLRKEYKKEMKEKADRIAKLQVPVKPSYAEALRSGNDKHPMTGDLSRFTSSVGKE